MKILFLAAVCCFVASQVSSNADDDEATATPPPWQKSAVSVTARLRHLLDHRYHTDVKVKVANETFDLHRIVLAMTSHVWETLLFPANGSDSTGPAPSLLTIDNVKPSTFRLLLSYMYVNKTEFPASATETWDLWKAALHYEIEDLAKKTAKHINAGFTSDNVLDAVGQAIANNNAYLEERCWEFIEHTADAVLNSTSFLELSEEMVRAIVERPLLNAPEVDIFYAIVQWAKTSLSKDNIPITPENINKRLENILPLVDLDSLTPDEFVQQVQPTGLLSEESSNLRVRAMLLKLLPTGQKSMPRRDAASRNSQSCWRWKNVDVKTLRYMDHAPVQQHVLRFRVQCGRPTCYLNSLQVTVSFGNSMCQRRDFPHGLVPLRLSDVVTGEELVGGVFPVEKQTNYTISFIPVKLKSNRTYRIKLEVGSYNVKFDFDPDGNCHRHYLHNDDYVFNKGMAYGSRFNTVVDCGRRVSVEFMNDPESAITSIDWGLIAKMNFI